MACSIGGLTQGQYRAYLYIVPSATINNTRKARHWVSYCDLLGSPTLLTFLNRLAFFLTRGSFPSNAYLLTRFQTHTFKNITSSDELKTASAIFQLFKQCEDLYRVDSQKQTLDSIEQDLLDIQLSQTPQSESESVERTLSANIKTKGEQPFSENQHIDVAASQRTAVIAPVQMTPSRTVPQGLTSVTPKHSNEQRLPSELLTELRTPSKELPLLKFKFKREHETPKPKLQPKYKLNNEVLPDFEPFVRKGSEKATNIPILEKEVEFLKEYLVKLPTLTEPFEKAMLREKELADLIAVDTHQLAQCETERTRLKQMIKVLEQDSNEVSLLYSTAKKSRSQRLPFYSDERVEEINQAMSAANSKWRVPRQLYKSDMLEISKIQKDTLDAQMIDLESNLIKYKSELQTLRATPIDGLEFDKFKEVVASKKETIEMWQRQMKNRTNLIIAAKKSHDPHRSGIKARPRVAFLNDSAAGPENPLLNEQVQTKFPSLQTIFDFQTDVKNGILIAKTGDVGELMKKLTTDGSDNI